MAVALAVAVDLAVVDLVFPIGAEAEVVIVAAAELVDAEVAAAAAAAAFAAERLDVPRRDLSVLANSRYTADWVVSAWKGKGCEMGIRTKGIRT